MVIKNVRKAQYEAEKACAVETLRLVEGDGKEVESKALWQVMKLEDLLLYGDEARRNSVLIP